MKGSKNWPYAYHNIQESFKELIPHLQRNKLKEPQPLNQYIDPKVTSDQLGKYIEILSDSIATLKASTTLEHKVTGMLIERFIMDTQSFKESLDHEIEASGLPSTQSGFSDAQ